MAMLRLREVKRSVVCGGVPNCSVMNYCNATLGTARPSDAVQCLNDSSGDAGSGAVRCRGELKRRYEKWSWVWLCFATRSLAGSGVVLR